jgi:hypothetical protein
MMPTLPIEHAVLSRNVLRRCRKLGNMAVHARRVGFQARIGMYTPITRIPVRAFDRHMTFWNQKAKHEP